MQGNTLTTVLHQTVLQLQGYSVLSARAIGGETDYDLGLAGCIVIGCCFLCQGSNGWNYIHLDFSSMLI